MVRPYARMLFSLKKNEARMQAPAGLGLENVRKEGGQTQEATRYDSIATKCLQ